MSRNQRIQRVTLRIVAALALIVSMHVQSPAPELPVGDSFFMPPDH